MTIKPGFQLSFADVLSRVRNHAWWMCHALFALVLFACMGGSVSAQAEQGADWGPAVNLSEVLGGQCSYRASIAVDTGGTVHVVWGECLSSKPDSPARSIYYRYLRDRDWSLPVDIITTDGSAIENCLLQATADGQLHIVWVQQSGYELQVYSSWAPIDGASSARAWAQPVFVSTSTEYIDFKAGDDGTLWLAYSQDDPGSVYLATSRNLGRSWIHHQVYPQPASVMSLALDEGGVLHLVWGRDDNAEGTLGTIYYARSADDGTSWSVPWIVDEKRIGDTRYSETYRPSFPSVTTSAADQVHVVWLGAPSNQRWHRWSADGGRTWSDPVQIDPLLRARNGFSPIVADNTGTIHLFSPGHDWTQTGVGGIWYASWDASSGQWSAPRLIDSHYQHDYHLASMVIDRGNMLYAVLEDHRDASSLGALRFDIWFMQGAIPIPASRPLHMPTLAVSPTPGQPPDPTPSPTSAPVSHQATPPVGAVIDQGQGSPASSIAVGVIATILCLGLASIAVRSHNRRG